jgi:hypothetical protein
MSVASEIDAG